ncbi:protein kinase [Streptomyces sp. ISL-66]|uniref:serine/threonine-protein kinase n=1 Tax=Streptomyces sp. ISL-66 TaxID=2819186 RepID=UPI001BE8EE64|nr:serine/threonine protein kinase [Streptomyces sp. ISL-66]MBT2468532.1 protein kinase [Streptomyces sp. ISL-66]
MLELTGSGAGPLEAGDPQRIGPIPLAGRLGAGGMGRVYLGVHEGRYVAVKQLLASVVGEDEDFVRRFGHELDNLSRLPDRATAPLLASDRTARPPWFATAYIPGVTLSKAVELYGGALPADALWLLLREAAAGLAAVHGLGMVHRDLKPSNVMLTLRGLTLIDFGIARAAEQSQLTRTGMVVGTPAYMAPEQASGRRQVSGATDVFALGSVLAYAASGRPPFGEESGHGVLYRVVHEEPELDPLRELDPELAELVAACLDKDPEGRPTAAELQETAARQGPFADPLWPEAVTVHLSERAAFAADVREIDVPTLPVTGTDPEPAGDTAGEPDAKAGTEPEVKAGTEPDAVPDTKAGTEPDAKPVPVAVPVSVPIPIPIPVPDPGASAAPERAVRPEHRRRRARVLLAVIPVVVVAGGTTLAIQHLPYTSSPQAGAHGGPSAQGSAPAAGSPSSSATGGTPSAPASAQQSPSQESGGADGQNGGGQAAAGGTAPQPGPVGGAGTGQGPATSPASGGSGTQNGAGGSANGGSPGGATTPRPPGGSASNTPAPTPPAAPDSGTYRYRNGNNGKCITQVYGSSDFGECSDASARWTVRSGSDGSFKLVNQQSGSCLYSNGLGQAVFVGACSDDTTRVWRTGSNGSLRSDYGGGCLDLGMANGLNTKTCGGEASQRWTKQS